MRLPPFLKNLKGYCFDDFSEAISRYLSSQPPNFAATSATTLQSPSGMDLNVASIMHVANNLCDTSVILSNVALTYPRQIQNVADEKSLQPLSDMDCSVVADRGENERDKNEHITNGIEITCNQCGYRPIFCSCFNSKEN